MSASPDLPIEVLCSIFRYMNVEDFSRHSNPLGWLPPATHVCRKWRRAAIRLSDLWAENCCVFASDAATDVFIQRAQSAPLVFRKERFGEPASLTKHQLFLAVKYLDRTRVFEQPDTVSASFVKALGGVPLSHLHVLRLHRWESLRGNSTWTDLVLDAPALRELYLDSVFFAVDAPLLRVLDVTNGDHQYRGRLEGVPTSEIFGVLKRVHALEELRFEGLSAFASHEGGEIDATTQVELPALRSLRLEDEGNDYDMYRLVHAAPGTDVSIKNTACDPSEELAATFAAMENHLRAPAYDTLLVFEEQDDGGTHVNIRLRSSTSSRSHYDDEGSEPEFRLDAFADPLAESEKSSLDIINTLIPHINIDAIHFLDIGEIGTDEFQEVDADELREMLAPFTNVSTVMLNIEASRRHILALREQGADEGEGEEDGDGSDEDGEGEEDGADEDEGEGEDEDENENEGENEGESKGNDGAHASDLPLPALKHLIVQDLTNPFELPIDDFKQAWTVILAILEERKRAGRPIRYLTLSDYENFPGLTGDDLAAIQELDRDYLRRAEELVEKVFDSRGYGRTRTGNINELRSGRISEFTRVLSDDEMDYQE